MTTTDYPNVRGSKCPTWCQGHSTEHSTDGRFDSPENPTTGHWSVHFNMEDITLSLEPEETGFVKSINAFLVKDGEAQPVVYVNVFTDDEHHLTVEEAERFHARLGKVLASARQEA